MKTTRSWMWMAPLSLAVVATAGGCACKYAVDECAGFDATAVEGPLAIGITVPDRTLHPGESFTVTAAVENRGGTPVEVDAFGKTQLYVSAAHHTARGWEEIERSPAAAPQVLHTTIIAPGEVLRASRTLTVGPTWPSNEVLRIRAWLNGREDVNVSEFVEVAPRNKSWLGL
ncbi:MAG: hypothetical protein KGY99_10385 [Phycisphaerae bacterium]|nr:hypothetical protein [Phycisphaerae bacterium]